MGDHVKEWERYRSLKRRFFLTWLSSVPAFWVTFAIVSMVLGRNSPATYILPFIVGLIWLGFFLSLAVRLRAWKCPSCHAAFESWWRGLFTSRCANCGLQKYS
jgi:hypothetical protein